MSEKKSQKKHALIAVRIHRALLVQTTHYESFKDHTLIPNKYLCNTIYSVLHSIHCHRPSAWATLPLGVVTPATKKVWCPMWGLWLVNKKPAAIHHQQQHVGWPAADTSHMKTVFFCQEKHYNVHYSSGWQADFSSAHYHHKAQLATHIGDHVPEGSAQMTSGDTRLGMETRHSSYKYGMSEVTSLNEMGWSEFLPRESGHLKWGVNWLCWPEEKWKKRKNCTVNSLWCQGHLTIGCLEHQTLW